MKIHRLEELTPEIIANLRYEALTPEEHKEMLALSRAAFTADDLQLFTELDEGIPAEDVLVEMEEMLRQYEQRSQ